MPERITIQRRPQKTAEIEENTVHLTRRKRTQRMVFMTA
jgi:hypothetical protein